VDTYIALLRGINVGGHAKVPMKDLQAMFTAAGAAQVKTYLQSGNVVFKANAGDPLEFAETIEDRITEVFGLNVAVVIRTGREMRKVVTANPFVKEGRDPKALHVMFLGDQPDAGRLRELAAPPGPDEFRVADRDLYLLCPNGVAKTKLSNTFFEKKLQVPATGRNWNTVTKVSELAQAL
jgi:uncharacterized protein (DUF1697 family)